MTAILPRSPVRSASVAMGIIVAISLFAAEHSARACETPPDLHIDVTTKLDTVPVRNDYTLADLAALAHQQHRDTGRALLGVYTSEFGYTIDVVPEGDPACPARIRATVTLLLQHRLIEIGQDVAANACVYAGALQHYRRLAEVDQQTVEHFAASTAAILAKARPSLKLTHAPHAEDLDNALREQIRAVVDAAIAPLHGARQDAQQTVSHASDLRQLISSCSV